MSLLRVITAILTVAPGLVACSAPAVPPRPGGAPAGRLVSMSPAVSEILYALDLGDRVVGVTRYCRVPAGLPQPTRVGGYVDPDWEALVGLRPDLVFTMESHDDAELRLSELGLATVRVDHASVDGVLDSFVTVADACGVRNRGIALQRSVRGRLEAVRDRVGDGPRPRVLVVIGRDVGRGRVAPVWVAGRASFYDDLLRLAGGVNAVDDVTVAYPEIGPEGLLALDPDVILDVVADLSARGVTEGDVKSDWDVLPTLRAVANRRVHVLTGDVMVIPGPRVAEIVETVAGVLHPLPEATP